MTLHVFVATTLTLLIANTMFTAWVTFLLYTPASCSGYGGFLMFVFVYVFGNALYLGLQFLVYLGYKLDAFLDAQNLDHTVLMTQPTTLLTLSLTCFVIGVIAILLAPLLPHLIQTHATTP